MTQKKYSVDAVYCNITALNYDGAGVGGYSGAKTKCEQACASPSAHMCTSEEVVRTLSVGGNFVPAAVPYAWYATGQYSQANAVGGNVLSDCQGWAGTSHFGNAWNGGATGLPLYQPCTTPYPIMCCD